jgi:sugar/nucleoside kinase (ribokinase family)
LLLKVKQNPFSDVKARLIKNGKTPFITILIEPNGKRLIASNRGCIDQLKAEALPREAKIIHFGGLYSEHVPSIEPSINRTRTR